MSKPAGIIMSIDAHKAFAGPQATALINHNTTC
jgi:hypothetical protein